MTPTEAMSRAKAAHAKAEAACDPRDKAAWRAAARTWERLAQPGVEWSFEPMRRELESMKREPQPEEPKREPPKDCDRCAAETAQDCDEFDQDAARSWSTVASKATIAF
jgi:hypothetical protein